MKKENKLTESRSDRIFNFISTVILAILLAVIAYPLYFAAIASISNLNSINNGDVIFLPKGVHFDSYIRIFQNNRILIGYRNTIVYTVLGTILNIFMTMTGGYALSVKFPGRAVITFLITFTMFFSGGLIPNFFLMKDLGILDTIWVMILPGAVSAYNLIIARSFLTSGIPKELFEAAEIDGCSRLRFFWWIVIPLSAVLISILTLFYAVGHWNSYFNALMYIYKRELYPLQLILRETLIQNSVPIDEGTMDPDIVVQMTQIKELLKYSLVIVASAPMLIMYPFLQKNFVKGVMVGSLKG